MIKTKVDLTGKIFGRWVVLEQAEDYINPNTGQHLAQWLCECLCDKHTTKIISQSSLKRGLSQSCGCLQKEIASVTNKKYNTYEFYDDYVVGYTTNTNKKFYIDLEDYEKIKNNCWIENERGYIQSSELENWRKKIYLHRVIMGCDDSSLFVDHKNHDLCNNKKNNLRITTAAQNDYNKSIQPYNTSGVIGVYYNKKRKQWIAQITCDNKHYCVYCKTKEEAIKERKKLEDKYFGEYSYSNSICSN